MPADGRLEVVALDGIPEVVPGDDVAAFLGDAIERTPGATPLREDDVLVVTQKIVSKAEGAIVDLTTVEPRPQAVEFATTYDRDAAPDRGRAARGRPGRPDGERRADHRDPPRLRLRERRDRRVERRAGERPGRDAPAASTRTRRRPASGGRSSGRFGVDVPVIVSDSFGRPWRWGIMDVAIGISGMLPLEDLRGVEDHDGRVMRSTVRAVADEIASAAELAFGKTTARPAAIVRGAEPDARRGDDPRRPDPRRLRPVPLVGLA